MEINVKSENQSGGETVGVKNSSISNFIWKGRREGFFTALFLAILAEIIIRLIFK
jgi:hypothetical protein